jgi:hypothetical protein
MLFSSKKIRNIALGTLAAIWMVSVLSLGMASRSTASCDPDCPMEVVHTGEFAYQGLEKKVIMFTGIAAWLSQYYPSR